MPMCGRREAAESDDMRNFTKRRVIDGDQIHSASAEYVSSIIHVRWLYSKALYISKTDKNGYSKWRNIIVVFNILSGLIMLVAA